MRGSHLEQAVREFKEQRNSSGATGATSHGATSHGKGEHGPSSADHQEAMEQQLRAWASLLQGLGADGQRQATSALGGGGSVVEENE